MRNLDYETTLVKNAITQHNTVLELFELVKDELLKSLYSSVDPAYKSKVEELIQICDNYTVYLEHDGWACKGVNYPCKQIRKNS